jgi:hypothetical protein
VILKTSFSNLLRNIDLHRFQSPAASFGDAGPRVGLFLDLALT